MSRMIKAFERSGIPTNYAEANHVAMGLFKDGRYTGWWWLRSPGAYPFYVSQVYFDGSLASCNANDYFGCIRPALWISLDSEIFLF